MKRPFAHASRLRADCRDARAAAVRSLPGVFFLTLLLGSVTAGSSAELFLGVDADGEMALIDFERPDGPVVSDVFRPTEGGAVLEAEYVGGTAARPDGSVWIAMVSEADYDAGDPQSGWALYRFSGADRSVQRLFDLPEAFNAIATGPANRLYGVTFDPVRFVQIDLDDGSVTDLGAVDLEPSGKSINSVHFADLEWVPELNEFLFAHRDITGGFDVWTIAADGASYSPLDHDLPPYSAVYHLTRLENGRIAMITSFIVVLLDLEKSPVVIVDDSSGETVNSVYREITGSTPIGDVRFLSYGGFARIGDLTCAPNPTTLCLQNGRFEVRARWTDPFDDSENSAGVVQQTVDSGSLWFLQPSNQEALVKVLDTCGVNGHRWVFASASTTLAFELEVKDTATGQTRTYSNPPGNPAPAINDTSAFPCS